MAIKKLVKKVMKPTKEEEANLDEEEELLDEELPEDEEEIEEEEAETEDEDLEEEEDDVEEDDAEEDADEEDDSEEEEEDLDEDDSEEEVEDDDSEEDEEPAPARRPPAKKVAPVKKAAAPAPAKKAPAKAAAPAKKEVPAKKTAKKAATAADPDSCLILDGQSVNVGKFGSFVKKESMLALAKKVVNKRTNYEYAEEDLNKIVSESFTAFNEIVGLARHHGPFNIADIRMRFCFREGREYPSIGEGIVSPDKFETKCCVEVINAAQKNLTAAQKAALKEAAAAKKARKTAPKGENPIAARQKAKAAAAKKSLAEAAVAKKAFAKAASIPAKKVVKKK